MATQSPPRVDGRTARSRRARVEVATALLDLLSEGIIDPTAAQIAQRAGVSLRLVFHHFADMESVYTTAAELQLARVLPRIKIIDPALPFERRVAKFIQGQRRIYEQVSPVRRAALRREPSSPELARRLRSGYELARNLINAVFDRELKMLGAREAAEVAWALEVATSWESWEFLRKRQKLAPAKASKVVERTIRALLRKPQVDSHANSSGGRRPRRLRR